MRKYWVSAGFVIAIGIAAAATYGYFHYHPSSGLPENEADAVVVDGWQLTTESNAIDGNILVASRRYTFKEKSSAIDAEIKCVQNTRAFSFSVSSYGLEGENGKLPANRFASDVMSFEGSEAVGPRGRLKLSGYEPTTLFPHFRLSNFINELIWFPSATRSTVDLDQSISDANLLLKLLPAVIEFQNAGGVMQVEIPANNDRIERVIQSCIAEAPQPVESATKSEPENAAGRDGLHSDREIKGIELGSAVGEFIFAARSCDFGFPEPSESTIQRYVAEYEFSSGDFQPGGAFFKYTNSSAKEAQALERDKGTDVACKDVEDHLRTWLPDAFGADKKLPR